MCADFPQTYFHRDASLFGPRVPAEMLERLWTMLAHSQGSLLNASRLAASLSVSAQTVTRYADLLADLMLVRRLPPFHENVGKRLVKSPKMYVRDSGMLHVLLGIADYNMLSRHPVVGASWEGFVVENLLAAAPPGTMAGFYRTCAGAEEDLVLDLPGGVRWAVEIKMGRSPKLKRGFHHAREDLRPDRSFVVYSGEDRYPLLPCVEAICVRAMASELASHARMRERGQDV